MALSITGQRVAKAVDVESLPLVAPIVSASEILDNSAPINNRALSGKRKGACVLVEQGDGSLVLAVARGQTPAASWDVPVTEVPGQIHAALDTFNWTGTHAVSTGDTFNLLELTGITHDIDSAALTVAGGLAKVRAIEQPTIMTVTVRLTGTTPSQGNQEWRIQLLRPDDSRISSVGAWRSGNALNFNYRESCVNTYTNTELDPFTVNGFKVALNNPSGQQTMNLTAVSIRITRIPG